MTEFATSDYLNRPLRSADDMAHDLEQDVWRLRRVEREMSDLIDDQEKITRDYLFLAAATAEAAKKEIGAVKAKIVELKERIATLRGTP